MDTISKANEEIQKIVAHMQMSGQQIGNTEGNKATLGRWID